MRKWLEDPVVVVGTSSALAGFVVGFAGYGTWQVATESAQVVAGLVEYPRENPFYMYHTKLWTLLHQVGALLLRAGLSEAALSLVFSGLLGAVSFPALALTAYAFARDRLLAVGVPFFVELTRAANFEIAYPIWLLGSTHTYGVIGLSSALLVAALFGNGCYRAGPFALGLLPAVHPSIGAWTWIMIGTAVAWDLRALRDKLRTLLRIGTRPPRDEVEAGAWLRTALPWFAAGALIAVASLAVHLIWIADVPKADPEASARYLTAFVRLWDGHRRAVSLATPGVYVAAGALLVCFLWLSVFRRGGPPPQARLLLRIFAVFGAAGLLFLVLSWAPPEKMPATLLILMPSRLVNLIVLAALPLLVGLLAARRDAPGFFILLALLAAGAVMAQMVGVGYLRWPNSNFHPAFHFVLWPPVTPAIGMGAAAILLVAVAAARRSQATPPPEEAPKVEKAEGKSRKKKARRARSTGLAVMPLRLASLGVLVWAVFVAGFRTIQHWPLRHHVLSDWRGDPLLAKVHEQKGLLITASDLHLIQLRTRRPVLIDGGGLDLLAYTLEAGPAIDKILRRVYGIDLFSPPPDALALGMIPVISTRLAWEGRGAEEWQGIGQEMGVTGVLTYADWQLRLPLVGRNDEFAFYRIGP